MKLTKCENGHFYDGSKYESCPHCRQQGMDEGVTVALQGQGIQEEATEALTGSAPSDTEQNLGAQVRGILDEEENQTVAYYDLKIGKNPVVGWLVCIQGENRGESYKLKAGRNFVGRSRDMDVVLTGDMGISRNRHAIIVYEPKGKMFLAQPGESRELFYINDKVVLANYVLQPYDEIQISATKLLFVPFCGERFSWDDVEE